MNAITKALLSAVVILPGSQPGLSQVKEKRFADVPTAVRPSQRLDAPHVNVPHAVVRARQLGSHT